MPKKIICLMIIFILIISASACGFLRREPPLEESPEPDENSEETLAHLRKTVLYFINENDLLVPVTKDIPWVEGIAKATLDILVDREETRLELAEKDLRPSLPEGTEVIGMTIRDGVAKVDFNSNLLNTSDKKSEQNAINSIVYTLTEFPTIDRVQILVDGKRLNETTHGIKLEETLSRQYINLETSIESEDFIPVTLYFKGLSSDGNFNYFVPVTRMVPKSENNIKTTLQELVKGPLDNSGLVSVLPKDTKVLDVIQKDNEVVVNFSKEIEGYGGGIDAEQSIVNSVVLTVSEFPGVETVSLQIEGDAGALPEGTVLDTPIFKPLYVNPDGI
ncbi:MAG: GerMN domain-containing protein [Tepidanaerobacteraceae bacterium]|nr:hypothetical protein [Thermoanaerobacterales bacterium]